MLAFALTFSFVVSGRPVIRDVSAQDHLPPSAGGPLAEGRDIFRFDTFGDEQLWTDVLRMHEVIPAVDPVTALSVGLKVDSEALPSGVIAALKAGEVDLTDPAVTLALLQLNAVVGVVGSVNEAGQLTSVGVTCAQPVNPAAISG